MDGFTLLWLELKNYAQLAIEHMQETNKNRIPSYQLQSGYLHQLVNNVSSTLYLWTNFVPTQNRVNRNSYFAPQKTHPMCTYFSKSLRLTFETARENVPVNLLNALIEHKASPL